MPLTEPDRPFFHPKPTSRNRKPRCPLVPVVTIARQTAMGPPPIAGTFGKDLQINWCCGDTPPACLKLQKIAQVGPTRKRGKPTQQDGFVRTNNTRSDGLASGQRCVTLYCARLGMARISPSHDAWYPLGSVLCRDNHQGMRRDRCTNGSVEEPAHHFGWCCLLVFVDLPLQEATANWFREADRWWL